MFAYFQDLITTAFDFEGIDRNARKFAFAQLMVGGVIVIGVPFKILMMIGDAVRNRRAKASIYAEVKKDMPEGASRELVREAAMRAELERRQAYAAPLAPPIDLAPEPVDGSYFVSLRAFAEEKQKSGAAMNAYEREAAGPIAFLFDSFGPKGFGHFDALYSTPPYRSHELSALLETLNLPDLMSAVESAMGLHLQRYQLYRDFAATGMPAEQARAHPDMPSYDALNNTVNIAGGQARFLRAADQYLQAAYPWVPNSGF
ncbi:hypothetical protein DS901_06075 [Loktanella sp. D2R18]|uniref:hypothetical protein n=1 Tax=Rhodobacterales TaxID=204455 RepID=UPI000DE980EA|nr:MULTISPECIES: hypothetical protein [Rhodobacterales]MDO6590572.1 hypothetical protein [Yoonia sp. 1_MG-2023]RBW44794.1 hypothetical protein DS901_06075 [Loktanella sp. D2R18]